MIQIKITNTSQNELPEYATLGAAGMDIRAHLVENIELLPLQRALIPTGLFMEIPFGFEVQIRPRSGLAYKNGITVLNSPGTIDSDYRGEIGVLLVNLSNESFTIQSGDRIAQMVISKHEHATFQESKSLETSTRGDGGFGSTGKK
jgi:dUTP pyrophosphatase